MGPPAPGHPSTQPSLQPPPSPSNTPQELVPHYTETPPMTVCNGTVCHLHFCSLCAQSPSPPPYEPNLKKNVTFRGRGFRIPMYHFASQINGGTGVGIRVVESGLGVFEENEVFESAGAHVYVASEGVQIALHDSMNMCA